MAYALLQRLDDGAVVAMGPSGDVRVAQLRRHVGAVARRLPEPAGGQLMVIARDRYAFVVAVLAAWSRGHAVALPPNGQAGTIAEFAESGRVAHLLHDTEGAAHGTDIRAWFDDESAEPVREVEVSGNQLLASVWTSGSTGEAQAHDKRAHQLLGEAKMLVEHFGLGPSTRVMATVPAHHIYGLLFGVLVPLLAGGAFSRETPLHAPVVASSLRDFGAQVLVSTPAHLAALRILEPGDIGSLDRVFSSGAPLPATTAQMLAQRHQMVVTEVLGSTETGGIAARERRGRAAGKWTPLPGVEVEIGEGGRLLLRSPFVSRDAPVPFSTDDRVEERPGGTFAHLGRLDDVVKIAGKRASIRAVEARLLALEGVVDASVFTSDEDDARGVRLRALACAPGWSSDALRAELRKHFDPVVVPREVRLCSVLPREDNGKLRRSRVQEAWENARRRPQGLEMQPDGIAHVSPDSRVFDGHFRGRPIVPGVEQLRFAVDAARARWPDLGSLVRVDRLKFRAPLRPGDVAQLELTEKAPGKIRFRVGESAEGTLVFHGAEVRA